MIDDFIAFVSQYSSVIDTISLIVSVLTLFTMLRFKHRLRVEFDKRDLISQKKRLLKELDGCEGSLIDGIYTVNFLQRIDLLLNEITASYKCLSWGLQIRIKETIIFLNRKCMAEVTKGQSSYRHKLCKKLKQISVSLKKEG